MEVWYLQILHVTIGENIEWFGFVSLVTYSNMSDIISEVECNTRFIVQDQLTTHKIFGPDLELLFIYKKLPFGVPPMQKWLYLNK